MLEEIYKIFSLIKDVSELAEFVSSFLKSLLQHWPLTLGIVAIIIAFLVVAKFAMAKFKEEFLDTSPKSSSNIPPSRPTPTRDWRGSIITPCYFPPQQPVKKEQGNVTIEQFGKVLYHNRNDKSENNHT